MPLARSTGPHRADRRRGPPWEAAGQISRIALTNQGQLQVAQQQTLTIDSPLVQQGADARLVVTGDLTAPEIQIEGGVIELDNSGLVKGDIDVQQGRLVLHQFSGIDEVHVKLGAAIDGDLSLSDHSEVEVIIGDGEPFAFLEVWGTASLNGS